MTRDECRDTILTTVEKYWDERLPDRNGLYLQFYMLLDPAVDQFLDEVALKKADYDYQNRVRPYMKGVGK